MFQKYLIEFLGTALLSFIVFSTGNYLAIGAALAIAVLLGGGLSGGAYNPAIAITLLASGKLSNSDIVPYIIAEILGALVGLKLVEVIM
jgi:glycerol uptake facilitator-like aquaporin